MRRHSRLLLILLGPTVAFLRATPAAAQIGDAADPRLVGRLFGKIVDDQTGTPIQGATIRFLDRVSLTRVSGSTGDFFVDGIPRGVQTLEVEHLGYGRGSKVVNIPAGQTVRIELRLRARAIPLDTLEITITARVSRLEQVGFLHRQLVHSGRFITGPAAESWRIRANLFSTGMRFTREGVVRLWDNVANEWCVPYIWLDGRYQEWAQGEADAVVAGLTVDGIEIYRGFTTPWEWVPEVTLRACGAIVIWTNGG